MVFKKRKFIASLFCLIFIIFSSGERLALASPIKETSSNSRQSQVLPKVPLGGGSYRRLLSQRYNHKQFEVHHVITRSALNILGLFCDAIIGRNEYNSFLFSKKQNWAPSIILSHEDHSFLHSTQEKTSPGHNIAQALKIILTGDFVSLIENEISFIEQNLNKNHKYDSAIQQLREYVRNLNIHIEGPYIVLTLQGEKKYIPLMPQNDGTVPTLQ